MPSLQLAIMECDGGKVTAMDFPANGDKHDAFAVVKIENESGELKLFFESMDAVRKFHAELGEAIYGKPSEEDILRRLGEQPDGTLRLERVTA